jgi:hypothetical protein
LLLECLGGRRDDDLSAREDGWDEVGEGLASAGACLYHEVPAALHRASDSTGHAVLAWTVLAAAGQLARDGAKVLACTGLGCLLVALHVPTLPERKMAGPAQIPVHRVAGTVPPGGAGRFVT